MPTAHPRKVRSFVKRAGRVTPSQSRALRDHWPRYGLDTSESDLEFAAAFQRSAPVVLEIGFGDGETLVQQAQSDAERNYLGIEVHEPGVGHCLIKARDADINNLRVIVHDAIEVLQQQIPLNSLQRINLYFPDPWPKKRHHKRRIVQESFLDLIAPRLVSGGSFHIATDWANYAEHIDAVLARSAQFECRERRTHAGDRPLDRPRTKFEARGLKKGHEICDWCFTKNA